MFVEMLHRVLVYLSVFAFFFLFSFFLFDFYAKIVMLCVWKLYFQVSVLSLKTYLKQTVDKLF